VYDKKITEFLRQERKIKSLEKEVSELHKEVSFNTKFLHSIKQKLPDNLVTLDDLFIH
jgi:hypothetical protein